MTPQQLDQLWTRIGWFASRRSLTSAEEEFAEAAWAACTDNLRVLFESGGADAAGTANPHTGWPNNVSLLYWVAAFGHRGQRESLPLARLLLDYGVDTEARIVGNGERGNTALQEALAPGYDAGWTEGTRQLARALVEWGGARPYTAPPTRERSRWPKSSSFAAPAPACRRRPAGTPSRSPAWAASS